MSKNVTHVFYSGLGGHGNVFFSLCNADKEKKFTNSAILYGIEPPKKEYLKKFQEQHISNSYVEKKQGIDLSFWIKIYKQLKRNKPNVIFMHGSYNILPGIVYRFFNPSVKLLIRETQANHLKTKLQWVLLGIGLLFRVNMIFLSAAYYEEVRSRFKFIFNRKSSFIIPNGIDLDFYKPITEKPEEETCLNIGMISRVVPIKDHITLIKSFSQLPYENICLKIAGDGTTLEGLKELVKELEIQDKVVFTGLISEAEIPSFLGSLSIYVHASFGETMSTSIMQAQACGLPIVASNVPGINNVIINNETGLLVELQNVGDLCEKLTQLIEDPTLRDRLSEVSRQYAEEKLSMERMFNTYRQYF